MEKEIRVFRFKLAKHPDIIGTVIPVSDNLEQLDIENPLAILQNKAAGNSVEITMVPYTPPYVVDKPLRVNKSDIFAIFEPADDLLAKFRTLDSGIILPSGNNTVRVPTAQIGAALP